LRTRLLVLHIVNRVASNPYHTNYLLHDCGLLSWIHLRLLDLVGPIAVSSLPLQHETQEDSSDEEEEDEARNDTFKKQDSLHLLEATMKVVSSLVTALMFVQYNASSVQLSNLRLHHQHLLDSQLFLISETILEMVKAMRQITDITPKHHQLIKIGMIIVQSLADFCVHGKSETAKTFIMWQQLSSSF